VIGVLRGSGPDRENPTSIGSQNPAEAMRRLNGISPYYTMFPLEFPLQHLSDLRVGDWVLDPFCGRGTTLYAARLLGFPSVGIDTNQLAVAIARAKGVRVRPEGVAGEAQRLSRRRRLIDMPKGEFWDLAFHPRTLEEICLIREGLLEDDPPCKCAARTALRAVMLGVLHGPRRRGVPAYLSNQMPRTYATKPRGAVRYWKRHRFAPVYVDTIELIRRRAYHLFSSTPPEVPCAVILGDSRRAEAYKWLPTSRLRRVITSPPYYGMCSYGRDQWLRLWFLGGSQKPESEAGEAMGKGGLNRYIDDLSTVWRLIAEVCAADARMVIRFGALPRVLRNHRYSLRWAIRRSVARSERWEVEEVVSAGRPPNGSRQANQFRSAGKSREEVDVVAVLR
jgi:hypothetical protein